MSGTDFAAGTHEFGERLTVKGRNFPYLVGFTVHGAAADVLLLVPGNNCGSLTLSGAGTRRSPQIRKRSRGCLEARPWFRAQCEDRIRNAKDNELANLLLYAFASNGPSCHVAMFATEILV